MSKYDENGSLHDTVNDVNKENGISYDGARQLLQHSESVSSIEDFLPRAKDDTKTLKVEIIPADMAKEAFSEKTRKRLSSRLLCCSLFMLALAIVASLLWTDGQHEGSGSHLVPT